MLADSMQIVMKNVRVGLRNALFTYSEAPAACGYFVTSSAYARPVTAAIATPTRNAIQKAPPTAAATSPTST